MSSQILSKSGFATRALLSISQNWLLFIPVAFSGLIVLLLYRIFAHPLAHIPGPKLAKITGLWRSYHLATGQWHEKILQIHDKYGPVVRIAPDELTIVDENAAKLLYGHGHNGDKTEWYDTWQIPGTAPGLFAERNRKLHAFLRKRVSSAYSMSAILSFEPYIQDCLDLLMVKLKKYADLGQVVDMSFWTNAFAFDVVGELGYGAALGGLETESDPMGVRHAIYNGFWAMANAGHLPGQAQFWFRNPIIEGIQRLLGVTNQFDSFQAWSIEKVTKRTTGEKESDRQDMLSHFLKMRKPNGDPAEFGEVLIEAMNIIGAGADTTSIAMRSCLYYICTHAEVYKKLRQEIDEYYKTHELQEPIRYNQTQEMPYLVATAKEAMRLLPSITWQLLRYAPAGLVVDGKAVPERTRVGVSAIAHNRSKSIWGENANEFKPERWLASPEEVSYLNSNNMTFGGSGPRTCIGRNIALVEVHKFLAQLLYHFDVEFDDVRIPWRISTFWFSFQHDMKMVLKARPGREPRAI